jgi:uncharacterized repeat protein (TIGR01451 family)
MELLERRQLLAVTIQRTTLNLRFSTDLKPNEAAYGEYRSFKITNTGPTALSDVWVRATNFSPTQKVQLGSGEDGLYFLGDLGVGAASAETAFIYMVAEQITSPPALDPQNFTIEVWRGLPAAPGSTLVTTQNDLFQWVGEAIQNDSSSRTFSVNVGYAYGGAPTTAPIVGGTMTMTVTGDIKNKPDRILFSPASTLAWPADAFVLEDAVVTYSKNPQLPPDTIFEKPIASKPKDFTVVYTFRIAQPTATATPVTPVQYTANGVQDLQSRKFDHAKILEGVPDIPPATNPLADLQIEKRDFVQSYTPGLPITWRITVTNNGPNPVTGARVSDVFPAQVSGVSWTAVFTGGSGTTSGTGNINELVNLAVGGTAVYTVNVTTFSTATGNLSNTATVTVPAGITDPNLTNNSWTDIDLPAPVADLRVTKVDGTPTYVPGLATTYTVTVTNGGPSFVTGARVVDTFSPLFTGVTWTAVFAGTGSSGTGSGSGSINQVVNLAAGGTATYTIVATVASTATTQIVNTASVTAPDGTTDPNLANNSATDTNQAAPRVNLVIGKTDGTGTYVPGQTLTYTVTVTNSGPSLLTGGRVVDVLPATIVGATWSASYTGSGSSGTGSGSGNVDATFNLAVGGVATITVLAPVVSTATGNLVNTATVTVPAGTTNTNPVTSATDTDTPTPIADLRSFKTDGTSTYFPGTTVTYTITVSNFGPSAAFNARLTDTFNPAMFDVANVRWTMRFPSGSTRTGVGNIDQLFDLDRGNAERVITVTVAAPVRATATGEISNTSLVVPAAGTTDYNLTNNQSTDIDVEGARNGLVTGTDDGCPSAPLVRVLDPDTGAVQSEFVAYEPTFRGGVRVAAADLNGDGYDEILTAPGRGRIGEIRVWTQAGSRPGSFALLPFGAGYVGGVEITTGDFNGDGRTDIAAAMSAGTGTVSVFTASGPAAPLPTYQLWRSFVPFPGRYTGGVTIATADFGTFANGSKTSPALDRTDELVVGSNAGMVATVNVYDLSVVPRLVGSMRPITPGFTGGVTLSIGRWNADAIPDILVGAGIGGRSVVDVYSGANFQRLALLQAFSSFTKPNARVFTTSLDTDGDGVIDRVLAVQGLQGIAGTRGVTVWNRATGGTAVLPGSTGLIPPLRITTTTKRRL